MSSALESLDAVVIGGGISGLVAAHTLVKSNCQVALLEASPRFGGLIGTLKVGPYIADMGPQTLSAAPPLLDLMRELDLEQRFQRISERAKRYVYHRGRLIPVPSSPAQFLTSPILSLGAKLRVLQEPFVPALSDNDDESVASFVRRRAGNELLDRLAGPFIAGIYAGDPEKISIRCAAPQVAQLERLHGSVVRGLLARRRQSSAGSRAAARAPSGGFAGGNGLLVDELVKRLGARAFANARVLHVRQRGAGFALECDGLPERSIDTAKIVIATSADAAAGLVAAFEPGAAEDLRGIESPPLAQIALAYPRSSIGVALDGFGFLACRNEGVRTLGAVWNSVLFPDRCPPNEVLVTAFLGGATDRSIAECSDEEAACIAARDLARVMKISGSKPHVVAGFRWSDAIPQPTLGHEQRVARIRAALERVPGLYLTGSFLNGPSVPECIAAARATAHTLLEDN